MGRWSYGSDEWLRVRGRVTGKQGNNSGRAADRQDSRIRGLRQGCTLRGEKRRREREGEKMFFIRLEQLGGNIVAFPGGAINTICFASPYLGEGIQHIQIWGHGGVFVFLGF